MNVAAAAKPWKARTRGRRLVGRAAVAAGVVALAFSAAAAAAPARPTTRLAIDAALEAKMRTLPGFASAAAKPRTSVTCNEVEGSYTSTIAQCWVAGPSGKPTYAAATAVLCGTPAQPRCGSLAACVYSVRVLAPPPKIVGVVSVSICPKSAAAA